MLTEPVEPVGKEPRGARKRRRRAIGLLASAMFHTLVFLLCFASLKGAAATGGGGVQDGEVNAINISLAGLKGPTHPDAQRQTAAAMQALFLKIRAAQDGLAAQDRQKPQPQGDLDRLFDVEDSPASRGGGDTDVDKGGAGAASSAPAKDAKQKRGRNDTPVRAGSGAATSSGDLWGQIKPCWDALPAFETVPVTLEVVIDSRGMISVPPKILRNGATPNERQLTSEARALAALSTCVPYRNSDGTGRPGRFEVQFAAR
ncbi:MAG: hypothetical protein P4L73_05250 [Caulobacteraceae bacterium]|nr:hypothetical protein [Caulobacteraceae bacterium]